MSSYIQKIEQAFPNMSAILKPCESEHFALQYFTVTKEDVQMMKLRDMIHGRDEYDGFKEGTFVRLVRKPCSFGDLMISDTFMEKKTQYDFVKAAHGDVLIGGLGMGMVLLAVQDKPSVSYVTVVELEQEVIDLVKPQLPLNRKVTVICQDIFAYYLRAKFDTIYFDIWDNLCGDNWESMKKLERKFRPKLKQGGWMSCWRKEDTRRRANE